MSAKGEERWIYGVVPAGSSLEKLQGREEKLPGVWVVETDDLGAIVGELPKNNEEGTRNQALAHARVLESAAADAPVVPFGFGVVVPGGDEGVGEELLQARHDELAQLLHRVDGRVQLTLKVTYDRDRLLREVLESNPEIARLRETTRAYGDDEAGRNDQVRLGELIGTAVEQQRKADATEILEALKPVSIAGLLDDVETEYMVVNAPFLVERDRIKEFEQAVESLAEERRERMRFTLLGPMPAYHFIDMEAPAWV